MDNVTRNDEKAVLIARAIYLNPETESALTRSVSFIMPFMMDGAHSFGMCLTRLCFAATCLVLIYIRTCSRAAFRLPLLLYWCPRNVRLQLFTFGVLPFVNF